MVVPQTVLNLYKDVGWNNDYHHTLLFKTASQQLAYFASKQAFHFDALTYVRQRGTIAIRGKADLYYECNYCSFMNVGYGQKWFYAFVTGVEYINDDTTEISFELDLIQTWMFDFTIGKCFVEREHVSDDSIGKHTVPENLPFGDAVTLSTAEYKYTPVVIVKYAGSAYSGDIVNNIYDPLVTEDDPDAISSVLADLADSPEKIAMVKMGASPSTSTLGIARTGTLFKFNDDTYSPVNNKLYTYPYTGIEIDDYGANIAMFKWEDFSNPLSVEFEIKSETRPIPYMAATPKNYKNNTLATMYMVVKTDFPDCPFVIDNFRAWLASTGAHQSINYQAMLQQQTVANLADSVGIFNSIATGLIGDTAMAATGGVPTGGSLRGVYNSIANKVWNDQYREINKDTAKQNMMTDFNYAETHGVSIGGQFGGSLVPWSMGLIGWRIQSVCIKPEYARMIDDFFTRFGYRVNAYKVPNLWSRATFNFVKTVDCNISGNVPTYASTAISAIFDSGITLWHTTDIGNYSRANPIVGGEENG